MRKIDLNSAKDCGVIFSHGDFVILSGKNPWLFRKDGSFVAKYKQIRNAYDMIFLPGNIVVMDGLVDQSYHFFLIPGNFYGRVRKKANGIFFQGSLRSLIMENLFLTYIVSKESCMWIV